MNGNRDSDADEGCISFGSFSCCTTRKGTRASKRGTLAYYEESNSRTLSVHSELTPLPSLSHKWRGGKKSRMTRYGFTRSYLIPGNNFSTAP